MYKNYINKPDILKWYVYKILLVMRLTTVILVVSMLQVSASSLAQKFSYVKKGVPLENVFKELKKQTGYNILWNERDFDASTLVNVSFKKSGIEEVVSKCLANLSLSYVIENKMVLIKKREESLKDKIVSLFSAIEVRGKVVDENGQPLVGAVVKVKGTSQATSTNSSGDFVLNGVDEKAVLVVSFMGYEAQEIGAAKNMGVVKLSQSSDKLQEVEINAGYYKVKKRELTGSIAKITAKDIESQPISNPLQALQGRVTGVEVTQLTGVPGGGFTVQIRGRNSIANQDDPLYIVNGVVYPSAKLNTENFNTVTQGVNPLSLINPNDIESIEVLKDADATAIYGSRGANGVVLITTKQGSISEMKIAANYRQGYSEVANQMELLNTEQYIAMRMEAFKNDGLVPGPTDYDVNGTWDQNKYTNWQDMFIGEKANTTSAGLNISGGTKNSTYLVSSNYYAEGTVFPGDFGFKRGGVMTSLNFGSADSRLQINLTGSYNRTISNLPNVELLAGITRAPNAPDLFDEYGKLNWYHKNIAMPTNPMAFLFNTQDATTDNIIGNVNLSYRIVNGLTINAALGYTAMTRTELGKLPNAARNLANNPPATSRTSNFGNTANNSWIAEPQLKYELNLGKGKINALVGMSFQENSSEYRNIRASNFSSDALMENIAAATVFEITQSDYASYKYAAFFSRLNYSLANRYFINLTGRRDASSRFGPGNKLANFGAVGAAWIFTEEDFIKNQFGFLSFGKLRGSYGITGNDQIQDYQYLQLLTSGSTTYQNMATLITTRIANPNYAWEINKKAEIALQLGFLQDRLDLQIAYYRNRSSNQLISYSLPSSVGVNSITANMPATIQNTGLEFEAGAKIIQSGDWAWSSNFNLTVPRNKLIAFKDFENSAYSAIYLIGKSLDIRRLENAVVNPQSGVFDFEDYYADGIRDDRDRYVNTLLSQMYYCGFQNSIRCKHFALDFLISYNRQNGPTVLNGVNGAPGVFNTLAATNKPSAVLARWRAPGDQTEVPKFTSLAAGSANFSQAMIAGKQGFDDNSYLRLKSVSFSYKFFGSWLSKIKVKELVLNLQSQNLLTFTKYEGFDPEVQSFARIPPLRTFSMGIQLNL